MRIVRLANYAGPRSGGMRTALRELGAGHLAAGHDPVLIIPGRRRGDEATAQGRMITRYGPIVPFTGGYRALPGLERSARRSSLPVRFVGFVTDPKALAILLACADVVVAPGPVETPGPAPAPRNAAGRPRSPPSWRLMKPSTPTRFVLSGRCKHDADRDSRRLDHPGHG